MCTCYIFPYITKSLLEYALVEKATVDLIQEKTSYYVIKSKINQHGQ